RARSWSGRWRGRPRSRSSRGSSSPTRRLRRGRRRESARRRLAGGGGGGGAARARRAQAPEEPLTALDFVASCTVSGDGVASVHLRLPTFFCAPNFSFLMVAAACDALPGAV